MYGCSTLLILERGYNKEQRRRSEAHTGIYVSCQHQTQHQELSFPAGWRTWSHRSWCPSREKDQKQPVDSSESFCVEFVSSAVLKHPYILLSHLFQLYWKWTEVFSSYLWDNGATKAQSYLTQTGITGAFAFEQSLGERLVGCSQL